MRDKGGKRLAGGAPDGAAIAEQAAAGGAPAGKSRWRRLWDDWGYLVVTAAVMLFLLRVLLQLIYVPTASMETTIPTRSLVVGWRLPYAVADPVPQRGAIVTFWNDEEGEGLVKRVVGLPGETVSFEGGDVYIDGAQLGEDYLPEGVETLCDKTFQVPEGCVFVMGDNREWSKDSRLLQEPYIPAASIQGQMLLAFSIGSGQSWQGVRWIG